jgi:hypothetical protein
LALPLLFGAYVIGTVNAILSSRLFHYCWKHYDDEYWILDEIEQRGHAILSKEAADLINAKQLILASALPLILVGIGWILLQDRWKGFAKVNVIGGIICIIAGLSTPLLARVIHLSLRAIHKSLKREHTDTLNQSCRSGSKNQDKVLRQTVVRGPVHEEADKHSAD